MTDYLKINNKAYTSSAEFSEKIKSLANSSNYLAVENDGTITEIGLWDKILTVVGSWLRLRENNTTPHKLDSALSVICENNKHLIDESTLDNILLLSIHAYIIKPIKNNDLKSTNEILGATKNIHRVADLFNQLKNDPPLSRPSSPIQKEIIKEITEQVSSRKENTINQTHFHTATEKANSEEVSTSEETSVDENEAPHQTPLPTIIQAVKAPSISEETSEAVTNSAAEANPEKHIDDENEAPQQTPLPTIIEAVKAPSISEETSEEIPTIESNPEEEISNKNDVSNRTSLSSSSEDESKDSAVNTKIPVPLPIFPKEEQPIEGGGYLASAVKIMGIIGGIFVAASFMKNSSLVSDHSITPLPHSQSLMGGTSFRMESNFHNMTHPINENFSHDFRGQGRLVSPEGTIMQGYFEQGLLTNGVKTYKTGVVENGVFDDGRFIYGEKTYKGVKENGAFKNGQLEGEGIITYEDGTVKKGTFKNGEILSGIIYYKSGQIEKGTFFEGKFFVGSRKYGDIVERGTFSPDNGNLIDGVKVLGKNMYESGIFEGKSLIEGMRSLSAHTFEKGTFVDGELCGKGERTNYNGVKEEGIFEEGELIDGLIIHSDREEKGTFEGSHLIKGIKTFVDGMIEEGSFKLRWLHGQGKRIYPDGKEEEGLFELSDFREGKRTYADGKQYVGIFKNGKFIKGEIIHANGKIELVDLSKIVP